MYVAQRCFGLFDEGIEDGIYGSAAIRDFVGVDPTWGAAPDATTLGKFYNLLEAHDPPDLRDDQRASGRSRADDARGDNCRCYLDRCATVD